MAERAEGHRHRQLLRGLEQVHPDDRLDSDRDAGRRALADRGVLPTPPAPLRRTPGRHGAGMNATRIPFLSLVPGEDADDVRAAIDRVNARGWVVPGPEGEACGT